MKTESRIALAFRGVRISESDKRRLKVCLSDDLERIDEELRCIEIYMLQRLPITPERWTRILREHSEYRARRSGGGICRVVEKLMSEYDLGAVSKRVRERCCLGDRWGG